MCVSPGRPCTLVVQPCTHRHAAAHACGSAYDCPRRVQALTCRAAGRQPPSPEEQPWFLAVRAVGLSLDYRRGRYGPGSPRWRDGDERGGFVGGRCTTAGPRAAPYPSTPSPFPPGTLSPLKTSVAYQSPNKLPMSAEQEAAVAEEETSVVAESGGAAAAMLAGSPSCPAGSAPGGGGSMSSICCMLRASIAAASPARAQASSRTLRRVGELRTRSGMSLACSINSNRYVYGRQVVG